MIIWQGVIYACVSWCVILGDISNTVKSYLRAVKRSSIAPLAASIF